MMTSTAARELSCALFAMMLVCTGPVQAAYTDTYTDRPRVLMLGDSITWTSPNAIGWQVREAFAGLANVHIPNENFQDTDYALSDASPGVSRIELWVAGETWDVIDFNTGLHDMRPDKHDAPASYATKLGFVIDELKTHSGEATLIWRETTFVPNPEGNGRQRSVDGTNRDNVHLDYNAAAAPVVAGKGITIVDEIAALSATAPRTSANNVHYTAAGSRMLARPVIANVFDRLDLESGLRVDFGKTGLSGANLEADHHDYAVTEGGGATSITRFVATDLGASNVVEVTLASSNGSALSSRDRIADGSAAMTGDHASVAEDFVFAQTGANLVLTISGLEAGKYTFTGVFHDINVNQGTLDATIDTDGANGEAAALVLDDAAYSTGAGAPAMHTFTLETDGEHDVVITLNGTNATVLNGFTITDAVPTPAALPMGGLMLAFAASRARARRLR